MKRILVVDDDENLRKVIAFLLQKHGYEVLTAADAAEGLTLALTQLPSLVLSDIHMAGKSGFEFLKELRAHPETSAVPVIIMTGDLLENNARSSMEQGADDFLKKPFSPETVLAAVQARLQRQEGISQVLVEQQQAELINAGEKLRLHTLALEAVANAIVITNRAGEILWVNPAFSKLTGYTFAEVAGRTTSILKSGRHEKAFYQSLWRTIEAGEVWQGELVNKRKDGTFYHEAMTITPLTDANGEIRNFIAIKQDISGRKRSEEELRWKTAFLEAQVSSSPDGILVVDGQGKKILQNQKMTDLFQIPRHIADDKDDLKQLQWVTDITKNSAQFIERVVYLNSHPDEVGRDEIALKDGKILDRYSAPVIGHDGKHYGRIWTFRDITERRHLETQLIQAHKLESVGQLAAGIAHEINTPMQYVGDNTRFLKESFEVLGKVMQDHLDLIAAVRQKAVTPELLARNEELLAVSDVNYLCEQIPLALTETLEGIGRVSKIVRAMKEFSHPGGGERTLADLNKAIESTVTVARNEWKYVADLQLELAQDLPPVPCFLGEFNQCILNLIVNAAHTIADVVKNRSGTKGVITVQTRRDGDQVEVRVKDTGTGIPETARPRIFEPFFTTKEVGKGTGQGLTMVYAIIVKQHGGSVRFETETGLGTTFFLRLPLKPITLAEPGSPAPEMARH
jgi:PAS domain S-box-containing protein